MCLEQTLYRVDEGLSVIQVCAKIPFPPINCPVKFPFEVGLTTAYQGPSMLYISCLYVMNCISYCCVLKGFLMLKLSLIVVRRGSVFQ